MYKNNAAAEAIRPTKPMGTMQRIQITGWRLIRDISTRDLNEWPALQSYELGVWIKVHILDGEKDGAAIISRRCPGGMYTVCTPE